MRSPVKVDLIHYLGGIMQIPSEPRDCGVVVGYLGVHDGVCVPDELLTRLASCNAPGIRLLRTSEHDALSDAVVPPIDNGSMFFD